MTASIGISIYPQDDRDIGKLLLLANKAVNHARQRGGNIYEFFRSTFNFEFHNHLALESSLSYALERNELQVYYQPRVNISTGNIVGAEALLRWRHPEKGMISPNIFIPIAEETNLIIPIGEWLLKTVCQQTKHWQDLGFTALQIAVNISGRQFNQPNLYPMISQVLIETGLSPKNLELELTESILVEQPEVSMLRLKVFKTLGIQIAIDDFGTGYSSLSYLQRFPFDILKIDRYFISNLTKDKKTKAIATAIIQMARTLNLNLVAEGVENTEELDFLREKKCDEIQGYLFSCPVKASDFQQLLVTGKTLNTQVENRL
jgi:EAL domain-containing protein (putative c-di-GMP-specific phosphodiesterase class I)